MPAGRVLALLAAGLAAAGALPDTRLVTSSRLHAGNESTAVVFTFCGAARCGPESTEYFDVEAFPNTTAGQRLIRQAREQLAGKVAGSEWVVKTPVLCRNPEEIEEPDPDVNHGHKWRCLPDQWEFFRNAQLRCDGTPGLFDTLPKYFVNQKSFCPWSAGIEQCTGGCDDAPPLLPAAANGSYIIQFFKNATEAEIGSSRRRLEDLGGNITRTIPSSPLFWLTWEATFADSLFPEFCSGEPASLVQSGNSLCSQGEGGLEGVRRINYDLPV